MAANLSETYAPSEAHRSAVFAIINDDVKGLAAALDEKPLDLDYAPVGPVGDTLLTLALRWWMPRCVELLIGRGAKVNVLLQNGDTALLMAVTNSRRYIAGRIETEHAARDGVKIEYDEARFAARSGDSDVKDVHIRAIECLRLVIEAGAAVNVVDRFDCAPLFVAAYTNEPEFVAMLLAAGAAVNHYKPDGSGALLAAVDNAEAECVELLIQARAAVDDADDEGRTPLWVAASNGKTEMVELLLAAGASTSQAAPVAGTPLFIACQMGHVETAKRLLAGPTGSTQLAQPRLSDGFTPLMAACMSGRHECVRACLESDATVNMVTAGGASPAWIAASCARPKCLKLLLDAGAEVGEAGTTSLATVLAAAASMQSGEAVSIMVPRGSTPEDCFRSREEIESLECVSLLLGAVDANISTATCPPPIFHAILCGLLLNVQLLSSHGALRVHMIEGKLWGGEELAEVRGQRGILTWLQASRDWAPLQHLEALSVERARDLLRADADPHAGEPSALDRAHALKLPSAGLKVGTTVTIHSIVSRPALNKKSGVVTAPADASTGRVAVCVTGEAKELSLRPSNLKPAGEAVEVSELIVKAAEWSPQSHELFPEAARKRAVEVMHLGYLIAWDEERFAEGVARPELVDCWRSFVLPKVVGRVG